MTDNEIITKFITEFKKQLERKQELYDGYNKVTNDDMSIDYMIRYLAEELGEISGAITRNRFELAKAECIDLMLSTFNLYSILTKTKKT